MTRLRLSILTIFAVLTLAATAVSQTEMSGTVVSVVDGKTFVFDTERGRLTGTLQFVEVPEPEQPLSRIVREHFERLVVGKTVTFVSKGFSPSALVGRMYLNGLDMGQQLVRDGAAWHVPSDRSGQETEESKLYDRYEALAKAEKRGIWSIANLTPAWEFRARKDRWMLDASFPQAASKPAAGEKRNYQQLAENADMWVEVGGEPLVQKNTTGPMFWGFDADKKVRNVSTPSVAQTVASDDRQLEVEFRVVFFQGEIKPRMPSTAYVIGLLATSKEHNFAKSTNLKFVIDGSEIEIGDGQRFWRENSGSVEELVQYRIGRSDLKKIAGANKVSVRAGRFYGTVGNELRDTLLKFFEVVK